jgi:hypothetical protein
MNDDKKKCSHATCSCPALPLNDYCGDLCGRAAAREAEGEEQMAKCECHHPDCGGEPEDPVFTQGLLMASEAMAEA